MCMEELRSEAHRAGSDARMGTKGCAAAVLGWPAEETGFALETVEAGWSQLSPMVLVNVQGERCVWFM